MRLILLSLLFLMGPLGAVDLVPIPREVDLGARKEFHLDPADLFGSGAAPLVSEAFGRALFRLISSGDVFPNPPDKIEWASYLGNRWPSKKSHTIEITSEKIFIVARDRSGFAQAAATLLQLAEPVAGGGITFPLGAITDGPDHECGVESKRRKRFRQLPKTTGGPHPGFTLPKLPLADPATQKDNHAYLAKVTPSAGASQPVFGPQRLTNGIPDRFDHFLGFPTKPKPLEILIEMKKVATLSRLVVYERAVGKSWEQHEILVSADGTTFKSVGKTEKETRGSENHVIHRLDPKEVKFIKIVTEGCQDLTFPSFSRLSEVMAFTE